MRVVELIERKRDGGRLEDREIDDLIQAYVGGEVPDYQLSAFCMAVVFRGLDAQETAALTMAMGLRAPTRTSAGPLTKPMVRRLILAIASHIAAGCAASART